MKGTMSKIKMFFILFCMCFCRLPIGDCESTFSVYWNAPSESCAKKGVKLNLDKYEIKHNPELKFKGLYTFAVMI